MVATLAIITPMSHQNMVVPPTLLGGGVREMVRLSGARMGGSAYGTGVLHVDAEAAAGGPLARVQGGDEIELDVPARRLELLVPEEELARRREAWRAPKPVVPLGGYASLYIEHVSQAHDGADLDFLVGCRGHGVARESH